MSQRDLADSLQDILEAIGAIERFTAEVNLENFVQNEEKCFAVEKALEIIGEAVKNIPDSVRRDYPKMPWKKIAGMRDKLAHQYWRTDVEVVWKTVQEDVPKLKNIVNSIIEDLPDHN